MLTFASVKYNKSQLELGATVIPRKIMKTTTFNPENIFVSFHIGRGGRFHNQGHVSFINEMDFEDLIIANVNDGKLFLNDTVYDPETDIETELPREQWTYTDAAGNVILEAGEADEKTGRINFDGDYDTDVTRTLDECNEKEWNALIHAYNDMEYMSDELIAGIEEYCKENGIELNER